MIYTKTKPNCDCGGDTLLASSKVLDDWLTDVKNRMCSTLSGLLEFSPVLLRYFISGMGSATRIKSCTSTIVL